MPFWEPGGLLKRAEQPNEKSAVRNVLAADGTQSLVAAILRIGLAVVFIDFGVAKLLQPNDWVLHVPRTIAVWLGESSVVTPQAFLRTLGLWELLIGGQLLLGALTRFAAIASGLFLMSLVFSLGFSPIGVRDFGLFAVAMAVAVGGAGQWSVDRFIVSVSIPLRVTAHAVWLVVLLVASLAGLLIGGGEPSRSPQRVALLAESEPSFAHLPIPPLPRRTELDPQMVKLGRRLFHDKILSGNGTVACSSCHNIAEGGDDGKVVSVGIRGQSGPINAPTVLNSGFNFRQFWDGRASSLEEQAEGPITSKKEMDSSIPELVERLKKNPNYVKEFDALGRGGITKQNILQAIAVFERSLVTPDSPFDLFLRKEGELTGAELRGYRAFESLGCITCHQGVNIGGNVYQTMGKLENYFKDREPVAADLGRFNVTQDERDRYKFKVPTLRNISLTAPYFHDGSAATLEDAVKVMARYQLGYDLQDGEVADLVAFLESLTGRIPS